jgi:hypothetical protein
MALSGGRELRLAQNDRLARADIDPWYERNVALMTLGAGDPLPSGIGYLVDVGRESACLSLEDGPRHCFRWFVDGQRPARG